MVRNRLGLLLQIAIFLAAGALSAEEIEVLPASKIESMRKGPCTFVHVWASWCTPCLEELPGLVRFLETKKSITPLVLDISSPFVQENFSKKYIISLAPKFKTFVKPEGDEASYRKSIDGTWKGALPYSALYQFGKQKEVWLGTVRLDALQATLARVCH